MLDIKVTKTTAPKAKPDEKHLGFGNHYTDHMFIMDYTEGRGWHSPRIEPYHSLELDPAALWVALPTPGPATVPSPVGAQPAATRRAARDGTTRGRRFMGQDYPAGPTPSVRSNPASAPSFSKLRAGRRLCKVYQALLVHRTFRTDHRSPPTPINRASVCSYGTRSRSGWSVWGGPTQQRSVLGHWFDSAGGVWVMLGESRKRRLTCESPCERVFALLNCLGFQSNSL